MLTSQAKDVPVTEPKFDLERDFPFPFQLYASTRAEAARRRAVIDRLAALRNAPEPNLDAEEEELPDFLLEPSSILLEPEPSTALSPVDGQPLSPANPEDTEDVLYHVGTGEKLSFGLFELNFSDPYDEEWEMLVNRMDEEKFYYWEREYPLNSSQLVAKDDIKHEIPPLQSRVKSLKYIIPSSSLPYVEDLRDLLTFLRSKKTIHDFIVDNNIISIDQFLGSEEEYALYSSQLITKDDKKEELSLRSGVESLKYDIPNSSLPYSEERRDLLTFLKSQKVIHDFMVDNNIISIDLILGSEEVENPPQSSQLVAKNDKKDEIFLKVPESIPSSPSKPGISGSSKTFTITNPKTRAMKSQTSTSEFPKCPTEVETTQLSIAQATNSTDSPELIEQLELRYPHKVYKYLIYPSLKMKVKVRTKDYCITCDPRYRRDRKTWLLHAKNRHYKGIIVSLYF